MRRIACLAALLLMVPQAVASAAPRATHFVGIVPVTILHKWTGNLWQVWAEPGHECYAISQYPDETPFRFWAFRQTPGSRIDMLFGSIANARPGIVQISFNDGKNFDYRARVEHVVDWDAYVISLQPDALSIFHDDTFVDAYVDGEKVFWSVTHSMRKGEQLMAECLKWQESH